jgi:hypothetical protein
MGTLPTFADTMTYGEKLYEMELVLGDGTGNLNESGTLSRAEMMVIIAQLYGVVDEAQSFALPSSFLDVSPSAWYAPIVAYAQYNEWTFGYGDGNFGPMDTLNSRQAATFLLRTLGYEDPDDFNYTQAIAFADAIGIDATIINSNLIRRGEVFELMFDTVHTETVDGPLLGEVLGVLEPVVLDLDVTSIVADNLKEVKITFNKDVDESSAEDERNYDINGFDFTAELQSNDRTVILTLDDVFDNQEEFVVEIDGVESEDEDYTLEDYESDDILAFDVTVPVAESIELSSATSFEITFSEPMDPDEEPTIEIEDDIYGIDEINMDGSNVVEVVLSSELPDEGDYEVAVSRAYDYSGLKALSKTLILEYEADSRGPEAIIETATESKVVLAFNEDVYLYDDGGDLATLSERVDFFYHSYTAYTPDSATVDGEEITLIFTSNPLPEGKVKIVVIADANGGSVEDSWGNELEDNIVLYANIEADDTVPRILEVETDTEDANTIEVYFSEDVMYATDEDNYVIKDDDDDEVSIADIDYYSDDDENEYYVEIETDDKMEGNYTIKVRDITDKSVSENEIKTVTLDFEKDDQSPPALDEVTAEFINGDGETLIYVMFPENMSTSGNYSILNEDNYIVDDYRLDEDDDSVALFDGRDGVKITVDGELNLHSGDDLEIARMADDSGNLSDELYEIINMTEVDSLSVVSVTTIDESHLAVEFDGELDDYSSSDFEIENNGSTDVFASISHSIDDGHSIITGVLKASEQLTDASDLPDELTILDERLMDNKGQYVEGDTITDFEDGFAPSLEGDEDDYTLTTLGDIVLEFDEDVSGSGYATFDIDIWVDGEKLTQGTEFEADDAGGEISIEISADLNQDDVVVIRVSNADYIEDDAGNTVNDFELELEVVAP